MVQPSLCAEERNSGRVGISIIPPRLKCGGMRHTLCTDFAWMMSWVYPGLEMDKEILIVLLGGSFWPKILPPKLIVKEASGHES